jgi:hypothetical protein
MLCAVALLAPGTVDAAGTGAIKGRVVGPGGTPISEVWVCAYLVDGEEFEEGCDFADPSGFYSIVGLTEGSYKVEFWSESVEPSYAGEYYDDKVSWEGADEVAVDEGVATTGIDAELAEGATVEGEIHAASLGGGPVEDAVVCAELPSGVPVGCALDKSDGSYVLPGLPAGEYKIQFVPSFPRYNLLNQFYDHKERFAEADLLVLTEGETKTGIDADLDAGAEIHGTVYSAASGAPVSGISVCALFVEEGEEDWVPRECIPTSSTGGYALLALTTDSYKVVFSPEFKEFFGEELSEHEDDGYFKQYFDRKATLDAAEPISLVAPAVRTGIDGYLQPEHPVALRPPPVISPVVATSRKRHAVARHCRPGFRKKKVAGKRRCVKVHKHRHSHRGHRH